jgi:uncharacterized membrane-anchored protein YhcB (DUF1043 family)
MFAWISAKNCENLGVELALLLMETVPKELHGNAAKRQSKFNYAKEKMQKRIRKFRQEEVLNFYKVAKLLNSFKWTLKDANYDQSIADDSVTWVLVCLRA